MRRIGVVFLSVCVLTVFTFGMSNAQVNLKKYFTINAGVSFPMGEFGDDKGEDAGLAKMGIGLKVDFSYSFKNVHGLSWVSSSAMFMNGINDLEIRAEMEDFLYHVLAFRGGNVYLDAGRYYNFPIFTGIKFQNNFSPEVEGFGIFQAGINIAKLPNIDMKARVNPFSSTSNNIEATYDMATSFGFCFGGGLVFNNRFVISLMYYGFGKPEFDGEIKMDGRWIEKLEGEQKISLMLFSFGIKF